MGFHFGQSARYDFALATHSSFSRIPSRVLQTPHNSPRRHLSQAWQGLSQHLWSWSTWNVLLVERGSLDPQMAQHPFCFANVFSYHSGVTRYARNLFKTCFRRTCSGLASLHVFVAALSLSRFFSYQTRKYPDFRLIADRIRIFSRYAVGFSCRFRSAEILFIRFEQLRQWLRTPLFNFGSRSKHEIGCGVPANLQSFREQIFIPFEMGYSGSSGGVMIAPKQRLCLWRGCNPDTSIVPEGGE